MLRPSFREARLTFGRLDGLVRFPDEGRPVVIAGPNGSGKSTLLEGLIRTLFGFERRRAAEAERLEARRPWRADGMTGEVTLEAGGETVRIRRDFGTDRVRVESPDVGAEHFEGDGNPSATNQEARHYRRILVGLIGIPDLDAYQRTLLVRQGALPQTTVGDHLLRVAAGGHARVDGARRDIAEAHRSVTRRPIHPAARAAVNPRDLEKLEEELAALRARLQAARQAGEARGPLALERDRAADRLAALDEQIRRLEDAQSALARAGALELHGRQLRDWSRKLDRAAEALGRAGEEQAAAEAALREATRRGRYPGNFPERLAGVELRWRDLEALRAGPTRWPALAGSVGLAAGIAFLALEQPMAAAAAAGAGVLALAAWVALRLDARRRRLHARAEIARMLDGVPDAADLTEKTRASHLARYRAQRAAATRRAKARHDLAAALRHGRGLLREARVPGMSGQVGEDSAEEAAGLAAPGRLLREIETAAAEARDRVARARVGLDHVGEASLGLPDGVPPTEEGVAGALAERRAERARMQRHLQELEQELLERGTPSESGAALETALSELIPRREALHRKAEALEAAHALVTDAYDAFRARDQERLLDHVSRHVHALSGGAAGPIVVRTTLEEARVRVEGRTLPLQSPPLSFGELHALLLAVRLGAADFLAGVGILPPLLIDEPFAHLDRDRAAAVWDLLCAVASERQVIVTTQDTLLLDFLGVRPDLRPGGRSA